MKQRAPREAPGWRSSVHDATQLELVVDFPVRGEGVPDRLPTFEVDLYLVAPEAIEADERAYPKERFFADLTHRLRLEPPDGAGFRGGRIPSLDEYLDLGLDLGAKRLRTGRVVQDVKLFANAVSRDLKRPFVEADPIAELDYKRDLRASVKRVRKFRRRYADRVRAGALLVDEAVREAVLSVDEYLAERVERTLAQAAMAGKRKAQKALLKEMAARTLHPTRTPRISQRPDRAELERHYHRQGILKKFVAEALFLHPEPIRRDHLYRNAGAAVAAALAATFAELTRYQTTLAYGTSDFGFQVAVLIALLVVAYVFKDRIKDLSKEYFGKLAQGRLPDRESRLLFTYHGPDGAARPLPLVRLHEEVRRMTTPALPPDVGYVWRRLAPEQQRRPPCDVIHYGQRLRIEAEAVEDLEYPSLELKEILRFDVSGFLSHLDNPLKDVTVFDAEEGQGLILQSPKVYALDLVVRLAARWGEGEAAEEHVRFEAVRAVLDKTGIDRVERPVPAGRYRYAEAG